MGRHSELRHPILQCLAVGLLWGVMAPDAARAQKGGLYVGFGMMGQRVNVDYQKAVDNTPSNNLSVTPGLVHQSDASSGSVAYGAGLLGGYRFALRPTGIYLSAEADMAYHAGTVQGALSGAGVSSDLNQLGEVWPEDWSFAPNRSYGVTLRVGSGIPILGSGSGASLYLLLGLRRFKAGFTTEYAGCFTPEPCEEASELESGIDQFEENFNGWVTGAGLEKRFGIIGLRGEVRYTDDGNADRIIPFDEVGVQVPVSLNSSGLALRADILVYF